MDNTSENNIKNSMETMRNEWEKDHMRGKIAGGIFLIAAGCLFLARQIGVYIPSWIFTWEFLLIAIGFYIGLKHAFRSFGWMIPIFIGSTFLLSEWYPDLALSNYIWPIAIILAGLAMIFRPRRYFGARRWHRHYNRAQWKNYGNKYYNNTMEQSSGEDYLELNTVFGSINKNIISKDFKGGEVNTVFGSAKINLTQADLNGTATLEINTVFGGTQLIVPSHWEIKTGELTAVMGGVEDKRMMYKDVVNDPPKVLILKGASVFGGIEIMSY